MVYRFGRLCFSVAPFLLGNIVMGKEAIKERIMHKQNGKCALSESELKKDYPYVDTDRINPKANGGIYKDNNTRIVDPVEHMKRHGTYRQREAAMEILKAMVDAREQLMKNVNGINNRVLAIQRRTDFEDVQTTDLLKQQLELANKHIGKADRRIEKHLKSMGVPIADAALQIRGLGAMTIAYLIVYIDIEKAQYASSLWSYCGYHKASHERYEKGVSGGGNKTLRSVLYRMADSMIKTRSVYRDVYDREKEKLANSEKETNSRNTQGKLIVCKWRDTKPCHRHGAAMRKMIKHFLADFWYVWRTLEGLETAPLYVEEKMGHKGIIKPNDRGWQF